MKIERQTRRTIGQERIRESSRARIPAEDGFGAVLSEEAARLGEDELNGMFLNVTRLGDTLVANQSLQAAEEYRTAVRRLVDYIVKNSLAVKNNATPDLRGRRKLYATLEEIDQRLLTLLRGVLQKQLEPLQILHIVGEVKGLLISLQS